MVYTHRNQKLMKMKMNFPSLNLTRQFIILFNVFKCQNEFHWMAFITEFCNCFDFRIMKMENSGNESSKFQSVLNERFFKMEK